PAPPAMFGPVENPVRMMMYEHESAGDILRQLRRATDGYVAPEDACEGFQSLYKALADFESDLHQHIHLENNILFPRAIALSNSER
ncbi:MAG TPA: hemerythrin domain-containing protein, partial [Clostridia bacterium]|nr:hemerythrin domain-containing protein [Clostridia bacterium]